MFPPLCQCIITLTEGAWELAGDSSCCNSFFSVRIMWYTMILFQSLQELHIENNHLEYLPVAFGSMPNLEVLDCRHNLLKQLPDAICQAQGGES